MLCIPGCPMVSHLCRGPSLLHAEPVEGAGRPGGGLSQCREARRGHEGIGESDEGEKQHKAGCRGHGLRLSHQLSFQEGGPTVVSYR